MYGNGTSQPQSHRQAFKANWLPFQPHLFLLKPDIISGATYDSIEGRFRIIKKDAAVLKAEVDSGVRSPAPPRNQKATSEAGSFTTTPKKARTTTNTPRKEKTLSGRVAKSANATPTKKGSQNKMLKEELDSSSSSFWEMEDGGGDLEETFDANMYFEQMEDEGGI